MCPSLPRVNRFLFCVSLKAGGIIIGTISLLWYVEHFGLLRGGGGGSTRDLYLSFSCPFQGLIETPGVHRSSYYVWFQVLCHLPFLLLHPRSCYGDCNWGRGSGCSTTGDTFWLSWVWYMCVRTAGTCVSFQKNWKTNPEEIYFERYIDKNGKVYFGSVSSFV